MTFVTIILNYVRAIFLEGMLHQTADGKWLGFFSPRAFGANMMLAGIIGCVIGAVWIGQRAHFESNALETKSEVMEVRKDVTSDGKAVYALKLRWTDNKGTVHVTVPRIKASSYNLPVGTELDIKYDPDDPKDVRIETREGSWYIPLQILVGSVLSLLFGRLLRGNPKAG